MSRLLATTLVLSLAIATASAQDTAIAPPSSTAAPPVETAAQPDVGPQAEATEGPPPALAAPADRPSPALTESGMEGDVSRAELEALGFTATGSGEVSTLDSDLHIYGFTDVGTSVVVPRSSNWRSLTQSERAFFVGNFNVYMRKNLTETVRTMGEVRFLYLPNGSSDAAGNTSYTTAADYADYERPLKWGGVEIERIYIEWSFYKYLALRVGQFLTPYGIWNVDHGSPTVIPAYKPYVIGGDLIPERQTGFELLGRYDLTMNHALGYHLTLSNGQGIVSEYRDWDQNKAVGGRLVWEWRGLGEFRLGASAYYGKSTDATSAISVAGGNVTRIKNVSSQFYNLAFAADVQWKYKGAHVQAEAISRQVNYTRAGRVLATNPLSGQSNYPIDAHSWGAYLLGGYRFAWFGVMPFFLVQWIDEIRPAEGSRLKLWMIEPGINVRPIDSVAVKLSYSRARLPEGSLISKHPLHQIQAQVAWAF